MITNILWGFAFIIIGALMVIKNNWLVENFGRMEWPERVLGMYGGSRLFYKLIGITLIFLGFLTVTGLLEPLADKLVKGLFGI